MQRVGPPGLDGASRRHQGLGRHLAAEDPLAVLVGAHAPEDVDLDGLEVEEVDQEVQGFAHGTILPGAGAEPPRRPGPTIRGRRLPCRPAAAHGARHGPRAPLRYRTVPTVNFPERFLWGTATAAHQIEGGNVNNDWWEFEHDPTSGCVESSGDACDSFNR